jgi:hypothetical protein
VAVEHDEHVIGRMDWALDMGPGAGRSAKKVLPPPASKVARGGVDVGRGDVLASVALRPFLHHVRPT